MLVARLDLDSVAQLVIELIVGVHHIGAGVVLAVLTDDAVKRLRVNLRIDATQRR